MYTLYEVAYRDTEVRLGLFEEKEDALRLRAELRRKDPDCGVIARREPVTEYWACEGQLFDDFADLLDAYGGTDVPVVCHTTVNRAGVDYTAFTRARAARLTRLAGDAPEASARIVVGNLELPDREWILCPGSFPDPDRFCMIMVVVAMGTEHFLRFQRKRRISCH